MTNNFETTDVYVRTGAANAGLISLQSSSVTPIGYQAGAGGAVSQANFPLTGVVITGTAGQFSATASTQPLVVGATVTLSGTYGGTGSISGYSTPTTYYIIATNASTTFTLSATAGGSAITTTAGTPTGITYAASSKGAGVTTNTPTGQITMSAGAIATVTSVSFTVTNSAVSINDNVIVNIQSGSYATVATYAVKAEKIGAGSFTITVKNESGGSLAEALILNFSVVNGSAS